MQPRTPYRLSQEPTCNYTIIYDRDATLFIRRSNSFAPLLYASLIETVRPESGTIYYHEFVR